MKISFVTHGYDLERRQPVSSIELRLAWERNRLFNAAGDYESARFFMNCVEEELWLK